MPLEALALGFRNDRHRGNNCGCISMGMDGEAMHIGRKNGRENVYVVRNAGGFRSGKPDGHVSGKHGF